MISPPPPLKLLSNSWFPNSRMDDGYQICQNWFVISLSVIFWQQLSLFSNGRCDVSLWSQTLWATIFEEVKFPNLRSPNTLVPTALLRICFFCNYYDSAQPLKYIATTYIAEMDCRGLTKTAIRDREGYGGGKQNWTKVSGLMPPPAAVKPSHDAVAKWTPWPYCSHSTHLLHPLSSSPSLALFCLSSLKLGTENPFWPTNQIILYCHFPYPLFLLLPIHPSYSIILLSLPFNFLCQNPLLSLSLH